MQYEITITVTEKNNGEEIYRRTVPLPEQIEMLRGDIEDAMEQYEEEQEENE